MPRFPGCESTNHVECNMDTEALWECQNVGCGKKLCYEEGSDNNPDLCDSCWTDQAEIACPHCHEVPDDGEWYQKNVVYDKVTIKKTKEGFDVDDVIEEGECDPFPDVVCPNCREDINEPVKPDSTVTP